MHTAPATATVHNAFRTTGTATYQVSEVTPDLADHVGCPTATHRLESHTGMRYGYFMATGRNADKGVRVPSWSTDRKGLRVVFVPAVIESDDDLIPGYLGE